MSKKAWCVTSFCLFILLILTILLYPMINNSMIGDIAHVQIALEKSNFSPIEEYPYLAYSNDTHVVYYIFGTYEPLNERAGWTTYMAPYINENGHYCKYVDDKFVEIE